MAYVITQSCCKDAICTEVCPVDCIHPRPDEPEFATAEMLYIDPQTCIDCGACVDECPVDAIVADSDMTVAQEPYLEMATRYFELRPAATDLPPIGSARRPDMGGTRVAVVGTGPAACYAIDSLATMRGVEIDVFDRLPSPYGLIRAGVAPDHPTTKGVIDGFQRALARPSVHCHFGVDVGTDVTVDELRAHHHAVVFATGAVDDRTLGIPGEDLPGSTSAARFVGWYNGHPDHRLLPSGFDGTRAVIVGNGNVALDIARILVTDPEVLAQTDITDEAAEALRDSTIDEVVVVARRGPAQAGCTTGELMALGDLPGVDVVVDGDDARLAEAAETDEPAVGFVLEQFRRYADTTPTPGNKRIVFRFWADPVEIVGDEHVTGVTVERTEPVEVDGRISAKRTGETETIDASLVVRAIGYHGAEVPGVAYDARAGIIPNRDGRVLDADGTVQPGLYATGWIRRGPHGGIGVNKQCALDIVGKIVADRTAGALPEPSADRDALGALVRERRPDEVDFAAWRRIDAAEKRAGSAAGRPRVKFLDLAAMLEASKQE